MPKLEEVFGVTSKQILSYVDREQVDAAFADALSSGKQIIVYGSSKQGKTALVSKHLPYEDNLLVSLTPKVQLLDIYQIVLNQAGVRIVVSANEKNGSEQTASALGRVRALIPIASAEFEVKDEQKHITGVDVRYEEVPVNLALPQTVSDLLKRVGCEKWVILENFHYLEDSVQQQFAYDLRAFQELGVRFVILGVWREKNRMAQFNGDLLDRVVEIPVEPWSEKDFDRVADKGAGHLKITFAEPLIREAKVASFSSIGVFQELMKLICQNAGVKETLPGDDPVMLGGLHLVTNAIVEKTTDYASRHQRALEAIAAGHTSGGAKGDLPPLFLPYYLVRVLLEHGFEGIAGGAKRNTVHEWIRQVHHRGEDVRVSDMSNLLGGIANLQSVKSISPPILAYDSQQRMLQVVDSTFYFFIKNVDTREVMDSIQNPLEK